jgi:hypothetical protein
VDDWKQDLGRFLIVTSITFAGGFLLLRLGVDLPDGRRMKFLVVGSLMLVGLFMAEVAKRRREKGKGGGGRAG